MSEGGGAHFSILPVVLWLGCWWMGLQKVGVEGSSSVGVGGAGESGDSKRKIGFLFASGL